MGRRQQWRYLHQSCLMKSWRVFSELSLTRCCMKPHGNGGHSAGENRGWIHEMGEFGLRKVDLPMQDWRKIQVRFENMTLAICECYARSGEGKPWENFATMAFLWRVGWSFCGGLQWDWGQVGPFVPGSAAISTGISSATHSSFAALFRNFCSGKEVTTRKQTLVAQKIQCTWSTESWTHSWFEQAA